MEDRTNTMHLNKLYSPLCNKENYVNGQELGSGIKMTDETAKFNSASKLRSPLESAKRLMNINESGSEGCSGSQFSTVKKVGKELREFQIDDKENQPLQETDMCRFERNLAQKGTIKVQGSQYKESETSSVGLNLSSVLLPNPIPTKKRKSKVIEQEDSTNPNSSNYKFSYHSKRSSESEHLNNSLSSSTVRGSVHEDQQDFKDYNRRFHGKTFKERIEFLGNSIEENIRENVQENLQKVKEKILQHPKSSGETILVSQFLSKERESVIGGSLQTSNQPGFSDHGSNDIQQYKKPPKSRQYIMESQRNTADISSQMGHSRHQSYGELSQYLAQQSCRSNQQQISLLELSSQKSHVPASINSITIGKSEFIEQEGKDTTNFSSVSSSLYRHARSKSSASGMLGVSQLSTQINDLHVIVDEKKEQHNGTKRSSSTQKREYFVPRVSNPEPQDEVSRYSQRIPIPQPLGMQRQEDAFSSRTHNSKTTNSEQTIDNIHCASTGRTKQSLHAKQSSLGDMYGLGLTGLGDFGGLDCFLKQKEGGSPVSANDHCEFIDFNRIGYPGAPYGSKSSRSSQPVSSTARSSTRSHSGDFRQSTSRTSRFRSGLSDKQCPTQISSQEELVDHELKAVELINSKNFDEALRLLIHLQQINPLLSQHAHSIYINYLIVECYAKSNRNSEAIFYSESTLQIISDSESFKHDRFVFLYAYALLNLLGTINIKEKNYSDSVEVYNRVESLINSDIEYCPEIETERVHIRADLHIIYLNRANALMGLTKYTEAHKDYESAKELLVNKMDNSSRKWYVTCLKKFAMCKHKLSLSHDAIDLLLCAIQEILENDFLSQDLKLLAATYDQAASIYSTTGQIREMIKYLNTSLQIKIDLYGMENEQTALAFLAAGKAFLTNKEYEKAFYKLEAGNRILQKLNGNDNVHSANCYACMAQIRYKLKQHLQAIDLYEIALNIYTVLFGPDHLYVHRITLNLLYLAFILADDQKIECFENRLTEGLGELRTFNALIILNEAGNIFRKNRRLKEALRYYSLAINIFEYIPDRDKHYDELSLIYCNVASANLLSKDYHESVKTYKVALRILNSIKTDCREKKAQINANLGKIYRKLKHYKDARLFLREAERLYSQMQAKSDCLADIQKLLSTLDAAI